MNERVEAIRSWWYHNVWGRRRLRWKPEAKQFFCAIFTRHRKTYRMITGVRVLDYSVMEGGFLSVRNEVTDEALYCERCKKFLRRTMVGGRPV